MAELLVYNKKHWMDNLSSEELQKRLKDPVFKRKYDARYQKGDIVEVRPDGYWTKEHGFNKKVFGVVVLPGVSVKDVEHLMEPHTKEEIDEQGERRIEILRRRRYWVSLDADDLSITPDRTITMDSTTLATKLIDAVLEEAEK